MIHIHRKFILLLLIPLCVFELKKTGWASENDPYVKTETIWFLGGHMQDLFGDEYLKPMLQSGYDLTPMHQLKATAAKKGLTLLMADPNSRKLSPFSHVQSGIASAEKEQSVLSPNELSTSLTFFKRIVVFEVMPHQLNYLKMYPEKALILFLWEPPSVMPQNYDKKNHEGFSKIYTWNDQLVDNQKYFKFHYPVLQPMIDDVIPFESKKLCAMIAGNRSSNHPDELYTSRREVISFFEKNHKEDFDLFGKCWPASYYTYKGSLDDKISRLKYYKFSIAYENLHNIPGYITEKIFNCFQAGCVPVYLGASNIGSYIPKDCYIDRNDFTDMESLYAFMKSMKKEEYDGYIKNIQIFLRGEKAKLFSADHFVETVMNAMTN